MARALKMDEKSIKRRARDKARRALLKQLGGKKLNLGIFSKSYQFPRTRRPKVRDTRVNFRGPKTGRKRGKKKS